MVGVPVVGVPVTGEDVGEDVATCVDGAAVVGASVALAFESVGDAVVGASVALAFESVGAAVVGASVALAFESVGASVVGASVAFDSGGAVRHSGGLDIHPVAFRVFHSAVDSFPDTPTSYVSSPAAFPEGTKLEPLFFVTLRHS